MLFRLDNPRLVMNAQEFPENMVMYCLAYADCVGDLVVNYVDTSNGRRVTEPISPLRSLNIFDGMNVNEYVVPFYRLVDNLGRRGSTGGFNLVARSSYRAAGATYDMRVLNVTMIFPVIGGGIIRVQAAGQDWDIANPTFNPQSRVPEISTAYGVGAGDEYVSGPAGIENRRVPDNVLINAYQRTHRGFVGPGAIDEVERQRQERIANFDLQEVPAELPPRNMTPARSGRTNIATGRMRDEGINDSASLAAEQRRLARIAQIEAAGSSSSMLIGVDPGLTPSRAGSIVVQPTRAPKAPPKTRMERALENVEEDKDGPSK